MRRYLNRLKVPKAQQEDEMEFEVEEYLNGLPDPEDDPVSTFTQLPLSRWMPLLHYDEIK